MAGASIITALLNGLGNRNYPFVFGGDGAMVALPAHASSQARDILSALQVWVAEALKLDLRAAIIPIERVRDAGLDVVVARYQASGNVSYAMFAGGGATWAEAQMKAGNFSVSPAAADSKPDLTGLSCRWDPIAATNGEIVSIIIKPGDAGDGLSFRALLTNVIAIVSEEPRDAHPLPADGPLISMTMKGVNNEAMALGPARMFWVRRVWIFLETVLAVLCDRMGVKIGGFDARLYKIEIVENSDFRKFDDGLKMTVDIDANCS